MLAPLAPLAEDFSGLEVSHRTSIRLQLLFAAQIGLLAMQCTRLCFTFAACLPLPACLAQAQALLLLYVFHQCFLGLANSAGPGTRQHKHRRAHRRAQYSLEQAMPSCNTYRPIPGCVLEGMRKAVLT